MTRCSSSFPWEISHTLQCGQPFISKLGGIYRYGRLTNMASYCFFFRSPCLSHTILKKKNSLFCLNPVTVCSHSQQYTCWYTAVCIFPQVRTVFIKLSKEGGRELVNFSSTDQSLVTINESLCRVNLPFARLTIFSAHILYWYFNHLKQGMNYVAT